MAGIAKARQIAPLMQANSVSSSEAAGIRDCILLQTGMDKTGRFQEAVGEAIAKSLKAGRSAPLPLTLHVVLVSDFHVSEQ